MKGYIANIGEETLKNTNFRKVLYTAKNSRLVVMSINPVEEIGEEVHHLDQFIRCEAGEGKAILNGVEYGISDGFAIVVPAGVLHNIINTSSDKPLKLYTVYSPIIETVSSMPQKRTRKRTRKNSTGKPANNPDRGICIKIRQQ